MADLKLRRGQIFTSFGPGSIVDFEGVGFAIKDTGCWFKPKKELALERLSQQVQGRELRGIADENDISVPVVYFPTWFHCPRCKQLQRCYKKDVNLDYGHAPKCSNSACKKSDLVPMRFVAFCDNGHLGEINWGRWAHSNTRGVEATCSREDQLEYHAGGAAGGDFDQMYVKCKACNSKRNFSDLFSKPLGREIVGAKGQSCTGRQPWFTRSHEPDSCDCRMRCEPRGSTSIYLPKVLSALDISSDTSSSFGAGPTFAAHEIDVTKEALERLKDAGQVDADIRKKRFESFLLQTDRPNGHPSYLSALNFVHQKLSGMRSVIEIFQLFLFVENDDGGAGSQLDEIEGSLQEIDEGVAQSNLLEEELTVFRNGIDLDEENFNLSFVPIDAEYGSEAQLIFSSIGRVRRLREVRAFIGFKRGKGDRLQPSDLSKFQSWVLANECFGEGIYFELNKDMLSGYMEKHADAIHNLTSRQINSAEELKEQGRLGLSPNPLFILTHTISHNLINLLTFESGYSSSSLRERIYIDESDNYAGILVYTTDADAEGTLGGLVDMSDPSKINRVVRSMIENVSWCSGDPVCRETDQQGVLGLNHSTCHCCGLVSETSCTEHNVLLNRMLIAGRGTGSESVGWFKYLELL